MDASEPAALTNAQRFVRGVAPDAANRERDDFYPTPPEAVRALLSVESFAGRGWEPCCGTGEIARTLIEAGHDIYASDLVDRGYGEAPVDFLLDYRTGANGEIDFVLTNPPFKHAEPFVRHALRVTARSGGKVAMLCRLAWLEGLGRKRLFEATPLKSVWVFSNRLKMQRGRLQSINEHGSMIAFAWFVWDHDQARAFPRIEPTIGWLDSRPFQKPEDIPA